MKRILLISDTHSYIGKEIIHHAKSVDEIWHAGDIGDIEVADKLRTITTLRGVYGNIDNHVVRSEFALDNRFRCEEVDVWITHIGGYPNRYNKRVKLELDTNTPKIFITGHSHILKVIYDKKLNMLHMNPGSIGKHGFHTVRTMLKFTIDKKDIKDLEIIEFDR